jgi:hypothetical protein
VMRFLSYPENFVPRALLLALAVGLLWGAASRPAYAQTERMYFPAVDDVRRIIVNHINAETVRIDMSAWYLTEGLIVNALIAKHNQGVPIRLIGDRAAIFEIDLHTKNAYYRMANAGVPIRLRVNPTFFPEIVHWKTTIFVGQGIVTFGSANYTPFELAPASATNYKDETVLVTDDPELVNAFKTKFDQHWNDTLAEPHSLIAKPPYFMNWDQACARESACDFRTVYPTPAPMNISTARLELDHPLPSDMVWGQGPLFNNRLIQEINKEPSRVDFVFYRLTVDNITQALLAKHKSGVPVRVMLEPNEYRNRKWPEFWLTAANMDKLWAAGIPMKKRVHQGLTHLKMLVTSTIATNASSNLSAAWQRDSNYFVPAARKPALYNAMRDRFELMWSNPAAFGDFAPLPPDRPPLASPANGATGVAPNTTLTWKRAPFAVSYDVYLGTTATNMVKVGNVAAKMNNDPPLTYSFTPPAALQSATTYHWKVVSLTNASAVLPSAVAHSDRWTFSTGGTAAPPPVPSNPTPSDGATGIGAGTSVQLAWAAAATGTTYNVAFGTTNPPPQVVTGLSSPSHTSGPLSPNTQYFWRVTSVSNSGTTAGPVWSFTTAAAPPPNIVIYASDIPATSLFGIWTFANDPTSPNQVRLESPNIGFASSDKPIANPTHYIDVTFDAEAGVPYRLWFRIQGLNNDKFNESVWVQFSDAMANGQPLYPIGTTSALMVNLATDSAATSLNGWGWVNGAYWLKQQNVVTFATSGTHTMRIQLREDGTMLDQIVLSPTTYMNQSPGPVTNDSTIVPKP